MTNDTAKKAESVGTASEESSVEQEKSITEENNAAVENKACYANTPDAKEQTSAGTSWQAKLEGFGIMVKDMKTMVNFYHDVLGFDIEYQEGMKNVYLKKDGVLFMMYGWNDFESMTSQKYQYVEGLVGHYETRKEI